MNYFKWAAEYYSQADEIQRAIDNYHKQLKISKINNRYLINSKINTLKSIHTELIQTANELKEKALYIQEKEIKQRKIQEETKINMAKFLQEHNK